MRASILYLSLGIVCILLPHGGTWETRQPALQSTSGSWTTDSQTSGEITPFRTPDSTLSSHCNSSTQNPTSHRFSGIGDELTTRKTPEIRNDLSNSESPLLNSVSGNGSLAENGSVFEMLTANSTFVNSSDVAQSVLYYIVFIEYFIFPFFVLCCVIGNAINIYVLLLSPLRHMSNTIILVALAISDTTFILLFPFNKRFVRDLLGVDVRSLSEVSCKIFFFFFRTAKMSSSCFVALISIERFVAIWFPLKAKIINSKRTIRWEILIVVVFLSIVNFSWSVIDSGLIHGICVPHMDIERYPNVKKQFVIYGTLFVYVIPTLIMLVLSPMTVFRLYKNYKSQMQMTSSANSHSRRNSTNSTIRATIMLLSVTIAFVVLTAPITFGHIYTVFIDTRIFGSMKVGMNIFRNIAQIMEMTNFSINFFIYFSTSENYRSYLLSLFRPRRKSVGSTSISKTESTQAV